MHFSEWFQNTLNLLPIDSVVVLDKVPYHTMIDSEFRNPTTKWSRKKILDWIAKRPVPFPENEDSFDKITRPRLLKLCRV